MLAAAACSFVQQCRQQLWLQQLPALRDTKHERRAKYVLLFVRPPQRLCQVNVFAEHKAAARTLEHTPRFGVLCMQLHLRPMYIHIAFAFKRMAGDSWTFMLW
jgi:hypothetical protein